MQHALRNILRTENGTIGQRIDHNIVRVYHDVCATFTRAEGTKEDKSHKQKNRHISQ